MNSNEKAELLKDTIEYLYGKEGRSKSYIERLLGINRTTISRKLKEWGTKEAEPRRHLTPSNQKFLNKHREQIKAMLDKGSSTEDIARLLGTTRKVILDTFIKNDDILSRAYTEYRQRKANAFKEHTSLQYDFEELPNEEWKPILGYDKYFVSNMGRVKKYAERHKTYFLLKESMNKNGRIYVMLSDNGNRKNMNLSRIVGHAYVNGYSEERNTINHINGDITDNRAANLEWTSQSENNTHAYRVLNRSAVNQKRYTFKRIKYKGKYEFKSVAAFARFINKSETQTRRYLDNPSEHEIELLI